MKKYKNQDRQNPYIWAMSLPSPLKKFANRAKILTGVDLKEDILVTKYRRQHDLELELQTRDHATKIIEYYKQIEGLDPVLEAATLKVLNDTLAKAEKAVLETRCDIVECIQAVQQYEEIEKEKSKVAP